jgi:hypothetical protein
LRLEQFRTQHELARNFYDDHEFCPVYHIEEVVIFKINFPITILIIKNFVRLPNIGKEFKSVLRPIHHQVTLLSHLITYPLSNNNVLTIHPPPTPLLLLLAALQVQAQQEQELSLLLIQAT